MTSYRHFIPPAASAAAGVPAVFAPLMVKRMRDRRKLAQRKALLSEWEDEGGSVLPGFSGGP